MTFVELIKKVLEENKKPMSGREIWYYGELKGYDKLLDTSGKNPKNTITSILYTDAKKSNRKYVAHSSNPKRFALNK